MSLIRSSRLYNKGTGAPLPDNANVCFRGGGYVNGSKAVIRSMKLTYWWREKDYGDSYVEDWYFTAYLTTNMSHVSKPYVSFWRNFVYFGKDVITFGYHFGSPYIYRKDDYAVIRWTTLYGYTEHKIAATFDKVVEAFKKVLENINQVVHEMDVYRFPTKGEDGFTGSVEVMF